MRKLLTITALLLSAFVFQNCGPSKKAAAATTTISYEKDIAGIMTASCAPCHFPPDGKKEPLDSYEAVRNNINDIIERVKLPQSDMRFMPFKNKTPALSDSAINMLLRWKEQGMPK
jgi:hypothetical protein